MLTNMDIVILYLKRKRKFLRNIHLLHMSKSISTTAVSKKYYHDQNCGLRKENCQESEGVMMMINGELVKVEQLRRKENNKLHMWFYGRGRFNDLCLCWQHGHCNFIEKERKRMFLRNTFVTYVKIHIDYGRLRNIITIRTGLRKENCQESEGVMMIINGELVKVEQLRREEIINCTCGFMVEDGLMISVSAGNMDIVILLKRKRMFRRNTFVTYVKIYIDYGCLRNIITIRTGLRKENCQESKGMIMINGELVKVEQLRRA
ncbi:uncharacterized protein [Temnothorax nylanderi]|uniref:uncharacterized protein n=1 Tax=Temnothorax nylanderi TaxID=102681 RepID=UPI003A84C10E